MLLDFLDSMKLALPRTARIANMGEAAFQLSEKWRMSRRNSTTPMRISPTSRALTRRSALLQ
jgi:hypothetical protein